MVVQNWMVNWSRKWQMAVFLPCTFRSFYMTEALFNVVVFHSCCCCVYYGISYLTADRCFSFSLTFLFPSFSRHQRITKTLTLVQTFSLEILIQRLMRNCCTTHLVLLESSFKPPRYIVNTASIINYCLCCFHWWLLEYCPIWLCSKMHQVGCRSKFIGEMFLKWAVYS